MDDRADESAKEEGAPEERSAEPDRAMGPGRGQPTQEDLAALGDEIAQLAGRIAAAEARFLRLLGEFDVWGGWGGPGIHSLAHWLSWRAGMSLRTAQEHIRMARALRELPLTSRAFAAGELSFSKVRALTRVARPSTEQELVVLAKNAPAAHVERIVAGLRKVHPDPPRPWDQDSEQPGPDEEVSDQAVSDQPAADQETPNQEAADQETPNQPAGQGTTKGDAPAQRLRWRWDEQTDELVVWGRFGAADGKVILAALTRAELERIRTTQHEAPAGDETRGGDEAQGGDGAQGSDEPQDVGRREESQPGSRSDAVDRTAPPPSDAGPALVALAQIGLSAQEAPAHAAAAEVVYLHGAGAVAAPPVDGAPGPQDAARPHVVRADEGPALDEATGEEVLCGADARCVLTGAKGAVLAYGRKRRLFSATQLKALRLRDGCCQTPGCGRTRFLHAHHVVYWWHGGLTDLDNAVLLCSSCHRSVHLGRLQITALGGQQFQFVDTTSGEVMEPAPPVSGQADRILARRTIGPRTVTGGWFGEPLDLSAVTAELIAYWRQQATTGQAGRTATDWGPTICGDEVPWDDPSRGTWEVVPGPEEAA